MTQKEWPNWGQIWGGSELFITDTGKAVLMYRRGQRVRFYTSKGEQIGPEQANVAPAIAYAIAHGWVNTLILPNL